MYELQIILGIPKFTQQTSNRIQAKYTSVFGHLVQIYPCFFIGYAFSFLSVPDGKDRRLNRVIIALNTQRYKYLLKRDPLRPAEHVTVHRSAIRKTALRAYCGYHHRFTHEKALPTDAYVRLPLMQA